MDFPSSELSVDEAVSRLEIALAGEQARDLQGGDSHLSFQRLGTRRGLDQAFHGITSGVIHVEPGETGLSVTYRLEFGRFIQSVVVPPLLFGSVFAARPGMLPAWAAGVLLPFWGFMAWLPYRRGVAGMEKLIRRAIEPYPRVAKRRLTFP